MTLKRVLEVEVMDTAEEARDYNDMDHKDVNSAFVTDLIEFSAGKLGDVLDMGTGTALIPIELCQRHADCRVMAIDMAVNMLELARYNVEIAGLSERITLTQVDAKQMPYQDGMFDAVISNSIVHHIPHPMDCLKEMVRVTAEGGLLFVWDLMRPDSEQEVYDLVNQYTGEENKHSQQMFEDSLRAALTLSEIRELVVELGFDKESVALTTDRHWAWATKKANR